MTTSLLLAVTLLAPSSAAAPRRYRLEWEAPPSCPAADDVAARIDALLADKPMHAGATVRGRISATTEGPIRLDLAVSIPGVREDEAPRVIEDTDCKLVADAAALMTAIALERLPTKAAPEPAPAPKPAAIAPQRSVPRLRVRGLAGATSGVTPRITAALGGAFGVGVGRFAIDVEAAHHVGRTTRVSVDHAAKVSLTRVSAIVCGVGRTERWSFEPCAAVHAGAMQGVGRGFDVPRHRVDLWLALGLRAQMSVRIRGPLRAWWAGDLAVAVRQPAFAGKGDDALYRADRVMAGILAGLALEWPTRRNR